MTVVILATPFLVSLPRVCPTLSLSVLFQSGTEQLSTSNAQGPPGKPGSEGEVGEEGEPGEAQLQTGIRVKIDCRIIECMKASKHTEGLQVRVWGLGFFNVHVVGSARQTVSGKIGARLV